MHTLCCPPVMHSVLCLQHHRRQLNSPIQSRLIASKPRYSLQPTVLAGVIRMSLEMVMVERESDDVPGTYCKHTSFCLVLLRKRSAQAGKNSGTLSTSCSVTCHDHHYQQRTRGSQTFPTPFRNFASCLSSLLSCIR